MNSTTQEVKMSSNAKTRKFRWLGATTTAAVALAAVSLPLTPAKAQIGVQIGPYGVGVGMPYYYGPGPYYYGYGPYYHHHYHYYDW